MKILVINAGSSSLKYQLIDMEREEVLAKGGCERIGIEGELTDPRAGVIASMDEIDAVGHRVVASGETFTETVLVTDETMKRLEPLSELAPLHNPAAILGINACRAVMPGKKMALVFDTSFHATMPAYAYLYGIDYDDYKKYKVRKYGFHGTSHKFVSRAAPPSPR